MILSKRNILVVLIVLLPAGVVWLLLTAEFGGEPNPVVRTTWEPPSDNGFAGDSACASCHEFHATSFHTHPMAHSVQPVSHADLLNAAVPWDDGTVDGLLRQLTVVTEQGRLLHGERMVVEGKSVFDQQYEMCYAIGSGRRATAFMRQEGQLLFASPLNWFSAVNSWDLNPGYRLDDPRRFDRRITEDCLGCHSGKLKTASRGAHRFDEQPFTQAGIGCENCHGPGQQHIELMNSGSVETGIVNPAALSFRQQEAVCYQCHLHTNYRILRAGRSHLDFRPGDHLEDIWLHVAVASPGASAGNKANSHVQQMRQSRCFESGRLGCISCHDPHQRPEPSSKDAFYRTRCLECHDGSACQEDATSRAQANDSCIACHMPSGETQNIAHVAQTDHRILRNRVRNPDPHPGRLISIFDEDLHEIPTAEHERARALARWNLSSVRGQSVPTDVLLSLRSLHETSPDDWQVMLALGDIATGLELTEQARDYYRGCLPFPAAQEQALTALMESSYLAAQWQEAESLSESLLSLNPGYAPGWAIRAEALQAQHRPEEAIACAQEALRLNPTLVEVREWLVRVLRAAGRTSEADSMQRIVELIRARQSHSTTDPAL